MGRIGLEKNQVCFLHHLWLFIWRLLRNPPCLAPFVFSGFCQDVLKKYQRNVVATAARVCSSAERAQCVKAAKERVLWAPSG